MTSTLSPSPRRAPSFRTSDDRWRAVLVRQESADGIFFFAVKTTGVYCRPTCPAKRPRRENVRFFTTTADAEAAGYRPCKRCRPNGPSLKQRRATLVAEACQRMEAPETQPTAAALARELGVSSFHLQRIFKAETGLTLKAYAAGQRAERVEAELRDSNGTVTAAMYRAGFQSSGRFYESTKGRLGMTPKSFRAGGADEEIRFAVGECSLGRVLVAATPKGVCAILLGDERAALVRELKSRFPKARLIKGDAKFARLVAQVVAFVERPALGLNLPLDLRGTAFQQRVWQELQKIPPGSTASYRTLARRIKRPRAVRAVATACAANPLAVAVPCHRAVRTTGALAGYRWGIERKRKLLEQEARSTAGDAPS